MAGTNAFQGLVGDVVRAVLDTSERGSTAAKLLSFAVYASMQFIESPGLQ